MEKAIKIAIENRWNAMRPETEAKIVFKSIFPTEYGNGVAFIDTTFIENSADNGRSITLRVEEILLDPLFWQALGKGLEWDTVTDLDGDGRSNLIATWKYHWHRFIDHLAEGKDIESFFNKLIE